MDGVKVEFSRKEGVMLSDFELKSMIGKGTFAKVYLVQNVDTEKVYAMKIIRKKTVLETESVEMIKQEQKVLEVLDSTWLVRLEHSFQNDYKIYFVMEFVKGGDLFNLISSERKFKED